MVQASAHISAMNPIAPLVDGGITMTGELTRFAERRLQARRHYLTRMSCCQTATESSEVQLDFASQTLQDYLEEPLVFYNELYRRVFRTFPERWHQLGNLVSAELSQFEYCPQGDETRQESLSSKQERRPL